MPIFNKRASPGDSSPCPFLGLLEDSHTSFAFPSDWNSCHHCKPVALISHQHQREYCLGTKHATCPVYLQESFGALPRELRNQRRVSTDMGDNRVGRIILVLVLLGLLLVLVLGFAPQLGAFYNPSNLAAQATDLGGNSNLPVPASVQETPSLEPTLPLAAILSSPAATPTSTQPLPASQSPLDFSSIAATPTITRIPHQIESLIGLNHLFRIHRFKRTENITTLAHSNGTTVAAITAVNCSLSDQIRAQEVIIIPVNLTDANGLPRFEPYRVPEDTSLEALSEQLGVDPAEIQYYNGLGDSNQLSAGEWLVVPCKNTSTK